MMKKDNHLVVSALGEDRQGIVNELAKCCADYQCNIVDSRMTLLGGEFAIVMMISGPWDAIAKLETALRAGGRKARPADASSRPVSVALHEP